MNLNNLRKVEIALDCGIHLSSYDKGLKLRMLINMTDKNFENIFGIDWKPRNN